MNICNNFHKPIAFDSEQCPLCEEREERAKTLDKIVKDIETFRGSYPVN